MTESGSPSGGDREPGPGPTTAAANTVDDEHFKPVGTIFLLAMFVLTLVLLWASVYVILISRGVTT